MDTEISTTTEGATGAAARWLSCAGLRPTRQRLALASLLVGDGRDRHVTAEWLFAAASERGEKVSLATVYNTLRAFCEAGLLSEITVDATRSYFDTRTDDHPHFFWEDSQHLTDAPADQLRIDQLPEPPPGSEISRVDVVIRLRRRD
jgi:Fur family transcriptional regulator, iron response regulator